MSNPSALKYRKRLSNVLPMEKNKIKNIDMNSAVKRFIKELQVENFSERTIEFHAENLHVLSKFLKDQGVEVSPSKITKDILKENFILYMLKKKYKPNTINGRIKTIRKFLTFLYQEKYIALNIGPELKTVKGKMSHVDAFTIEQVKDLLNQPDISTFTGFRDYTIMSLMFDCGIRLNELCKLQLDEIDLNQGNIHVSSKGSEGDVPVSKRCCKILRQYLYYREVREPECNHVFVTISGTPLNRRTIQDNIKGYGRKADIKNVRVSPHTFRHSFAKHYILAGGDPFSLQKILRHRNMDTVKIYVNLWGGEVKKQHDKFSPLGNF